MSGTLDNGGRASDLAYIALASREPEVTKRFLTQDLKLAAFDTPYGAAFRVGATALVVCPLDDPWLSHARPGIDHIAIAEPASQPAPARTDTCGVVVRFHAPFPLPPISKEVVERIDHVGIASADNVEAERVFIGTFGGVYESRQTDMEVTAPIESFTSDKYGVVYHTRQPKPAGGLRVSFISFGDCELEFLQDFDPASGFAMERGVAGTTKQDQSAIGRFVETRGGGLHHIAFKVADIDGVLAGLGESGYRLIDEKGRPGSRRARIGFVHPASTGGVLFHFVERADLPASGA